VAVDTRRVAVVLVGENIQFYSPSKLVVKRRGKHTIELASPTEKDKSLSVAGTFSFVPFPLFNYFLRTAATALTKSQADLSRWISISGSSARFSNRSSSEHA
jgi:hypothetical protein